MSSRLKDNGRPAWRPVSGHIMTPWAEQVLPDNVWPEHPRPQMRRDAWLSLNGLWDYALTIREESVPQRWDGRILVPFAVDAPLSGVMEILDPDQRIWYRRLIAIPDEWKGKRVLLHFEAVDWETTVWVNGKEAGSHRGGYDPFVFDISEALIPDSEQEILVTVWDPTHSECRAIGKQLLQEEREESRYQPTGGIWQTVWLEAAAPSAISRLKLVPDVDNSRLDVQVSVDGSIEGAEVSLEAFDGDRIVARADGKPGEIICLPITEPRLWSPDHPFLYGLTARLRTPDGSVDEVRSYFGMRKVSLGADESGHVRIMLNDRPVVQVGPLDQGYWPDGILTPPTEEALRFDLEFLKRIRCNMVRAHVKINPDRWYAWCDRLGLLVWQDMVNMPTDQQAVTEEASRQWQEEFGRIIAHLHNHPSIIMWVPFNEGWSQHDTPRISEWVQQLDRSRLVNNASGWDDYGVGDILDIHDYTFYTAIPVMEMAGGRALVLGEAGGFNQSIPGHTWFPEQREEANLGYARDELRITLETEEQMDFAYAEWVESLRCLIHEHGVCAVVYTQITDVEHELNGWLTYNRKIEKIPADRLAELHERLYLAPSTQVVLPPGRQNPQPWRYVCLQPEGDWAAPDYDDSGWSSGLSPFGSASDSPPKIGTVWEEGPIYLRTEFTLAEIPSRLAFRAAFRDKIHLYLNGALVQTLWTRERGARWNWISIGDTILRAESRRHLVHGRNVLAVHCAGNEGRRFLDVGLVRVEG